MSQGWLLNFNHAGFRAIASNLRHRKSESYQSLILVLLIP